MYLTLLKKFSNPIPSKSNTIEEKPKQPPVEYEPLETVEEDEDIPISKPVNRITSTDKRQVKNANSSLYNFSLQEMRNNPLKAKLTKKRRFCFQKKWNRSKEKKKLIKKRRCFWNCSKEKRSSNKEERRKGDSQSFKEKKKYHL